MTLTKTQKAWDKKFEAMFVTEDTFTPGAFKQIFLLEEEYDELCSYLHERDQAIRQATIKSVVEKIEGDKLLSIAKYGNMPAPYDKTYKEGYNQALDDLKEQLEGK